MRAMYEQAAAEYALATGVDCRVVTMDEAAEGCAFCRRQRSAGERPPPAGCAEVHRYGARQAERFGGSYLYFCATSLLHWTVPLGPDAPGQAALVAGPVSIIEPDEQLEAVRSGAASLGFDAAELAMVPRLPPERATALCRLLMRIGRDLRRQGGDDPASADKAVDRWFVGPHSDGPIRYPYATEKELLANIARGDRSGAQRLLNEVLGELFFGAGDSLGELRRRAAELLVLLSRAAWEGGASPEEAFGRDNDWRGRIERAPDGPAIEELLARLVRRLTDCVFELKAVKHADVLHKALRAIGRSYRGKPSLERIAADVNLTPDYLGRLFRDELGMGFSDYVTRLRVDKAKMLLANPSLPLAVVAGESGFDDQSYFNRVFKRETGLTPGEFRRGLGALSHLRPVHHHGG